MKILKLLAVLVLLSCGLFAQHTQVTEEDSQTKSGSVATGNGPITGAKDFTGAASFSALWNINNIRLVDGTHYPVTAAGFQQAINDAVASCSGGYVIVSPGTTITVSSVTTDAKGTYGILINDSGCSSQAFSPTLNIIGYGATINYTNVNNAARVVEIRSAGFVTFEGFTMNSTGQVGTALSQRRPSNSDPGPQTTNNVFRHLVIGKFNIGIEMGVVGEGQVSENTVEESVITDCNKGVKQAGANTDTIIYRHVTVQSISLNGATLGDLEGPSGTLIAPITGDSATTGTIHYLFAGVAQRWVMINPHSEIAQSGNNADTAVRFLNWNVTANTLLVNIFGGIVDDSRTSGTQSAISLNNATTNGSLMLDAVVLFRIGGTATIDFQSSAGVFLDRFEGIWTNFSTTGLSTDATRLTTVINPNLSGFRQLAYDGGANISGDGPGNGSISFNTPATYGGAPIAQLDLGNGFLITKSALAIQPDTDATGFVGLSSKRYGSGWFFNLSGVNLSGVVETLAETGAPSGSAGNSICWADSTAHKVKCNNNNGGPVTVAYTDTAQTFSAQQALSSNNAVLLADFTTANASGFQTITGLGFTLAANTAQNVPFECDIMYSQATVVSDSFGIQDVTIAPTRIDAGGTMGTSTTASTFGNLVNLTTTTATAIVTATPTVTTVNSVHLSGVIQQPSNASSSAVNIMVSQSTAANVIVIKAGSRCKIW